jgi:hypothetical protein
MCCWSIVAWRWPVAVETCCSNKHHRQYTIQLFMAFNSFSPISTGMKFLACAKMEWMHQCAWRLCWKAMVPQCNKEVAFECNDCSCNWQCANSTYCTPTINTANCTAQTTCVWGATSGRCPRLHKGTQTASPIAPQKKFSARLTAVHKQLSLWRPLPTYSLFVLDFIYFFVTFLLTITAF